MINLLIDGLDTEEPTYIELMTLLRDSLVRSTVRYPEKALAAVVKSSCKSPRIQQALVEIIKELRRRNRILACSDYAASCGDCLFGCAAEIKQRDVLVKGSGSSVKGATAEMLLAGYLADPLSVSLRETDLGFLNAVNKDVWEAKIIRPFVKFAKSVRIIDKLICNKWEHFRPSLEWLIDAIRRHGVSSVTISTLEVASNEGRSFIDWARLNRISLDLRPRLGFPHSRGLVSNRLALRVDRGFDLLRPGGLIAPTAINVISDLRRLEM